MGDFLFSAQTYLNNTTKNDVINEGESVLTHLGCCIVAAVERWIGNPFKTSKRGLPVTAQTMIEERASH